VASVAMDGMGPEICGYVTPITTPVNAMLTASLDKATAQFSKIIGETDAKVGRIGAKSSKSVETYRSLVNTTIASVLSAMQGSGMQTVIETATAILNMSTSLLNKVGLRNATKKVNKLIAVINEAPAAIKKFIDQKKPEEKLEKLDKNVSAAITAQVADVVFHVDSWKDRITKMTADARGSLTTLPKECTQSVTAPLDSIDRSVKKASGHVVHVVHQLGVRALKAESGIFHDAEEAESEIDMDKLKKLVKEVNYFKTSTTTTITTTTTNVGE